MAARNLQMSGNKVELRQVSFLATLLFPSAAFANVAPTVKGHSDAASHASPKSNGHIRDTASNAAPEGNGHVEIPSCSLAVRGSQENVPGAGRNICRGTRQTMITSQRIAHCHCLTPSRMILSNQAAVTFDDLLY
jgi:hypothetical protein